MEILDNKKIINKMAVDHNNNKFPLDKIPQRICRLFAL